MRYVVWVDAWQLQCCGEPFEVGSRVGWTLRDVREREWTPGEARVVSSADGSDEIVGLSFNGYVVDIDADGPDQR